MVRVGRAALNPEEWRVRSQGPGSTLLKKLPGTNLHSLLLADSPEVGLNITQGHILPGMRLGPEQTTTLATCYGACLIRGVADWRNSLPQHLRLLASLSNDFPMGMEKCAISEGVEF